MNKLLLTTSVIALTHVAVVPANAAEWDVKVGGFMEQHIAYAGVDADFAGDFDGVDVVGDSEIQFTPSITLDSGLKIGADIQLEGNTSGDTIDESFLFIRGSFGEILIGSENSAGYKMTFAAPDVTFLNLNSGSITSYVPFSGAAGGVNVGDNIFRGTLGTTFLENLGSENNDANRVTYFTPRLAGVQVVFPMHVTVSRTPMLR